MVCDGGGPTATNNTTTSSSYNATEDERPPPSRRLQPPGAVVVPVARGLRRADDGCETRGRVCAARRPEPTAADPSRRRQWTRLFGRRYRQTDGARGPRHLVCIYSDAVALPARTTPAHAPRTTRSRYRSPPHGSVHSSAPLRAVVIPALAAIAHVRATLVVRPPARTDNNILL